MVDFDGTSRTGTLVPDSPASGEHDEPDVAPAVLASLRLAASLLDEQVQRDGGAQVCLALEVGGYRWNVTRCGETHLEAISELSPREKEIARMVAIGLTNRAIASVLEISPWTVGTHLRRIFSKLEVNSRAAMAALVVERGIGSGPSAPTV